MKYTAKPGHRELTTNLVVSAGHRLALTILDFERPGPGLQMKSFANLMRGSGPFLHTNPEDRRPAPVFGGRTAIHTDGSWASYLLLPVISG